MHETFAKPEFEHIRQFVPILGKEYSTKAVDRFLKNDEVDIDINVIEKIEKGKIWAEDRGRSLGRKSHAWFLLRPINSAAAFLDFDIKKNVLDKILEMLELWTKDFSTKSSMAFHDETTAQRVIGFATFASLFSEFGESLHPINSRLNSDISLLASEDFYAGVNNHGMFQDIALLVAYRLGFATGEQESIALKRLERYFSNCFTQDGVHTENNPSYHLMVAEYLKKFVLYLESTNNTLFRSKFDNLQHRADLYAAFALTPNGNFVPISDTHLAPVSVARARAFDNSGYLLGALTSGKEGKLPESFKYVSEVSGYAAMKSGWTSSDSHLFFSAAYNDDYHKHSDELSVFLHSQGLDLLAESGPNGYEYSDPFTKYAFSSFSHNTMIVDGQGLPRVDGKSNLTTLVDHSKDSDDLAVSGQTQRFEGVVWSRHVMAQSRIQDGCVRIRDEVSSNEGHTYTFLWHLGKNVVPLVRGNYVELFSSLSEEKVGEIYGSGSAFSTVKSVKGRRHPSVQGFSFPRMGKPEQTWCIEIEIDAAAGTEVLIDWEIRTKDFRLKDRGITPFSENWAVFNAEKPINYLLDKGSNDELVVVFSAVNPQDDFTYNYRSSLEGFPGHILYILDDFGDQGSYYLCNGRNFAEFRSVQAAIRHVAAELAVPLNKITTIGSSKGGTAAILHGVTLGAGRVIAGGPQYKIGDFVSEVHPNIQEYMSGGNSPCDVYWTNQIARRLLSSGSRHTRINVVVGDSDWHLSQHVVPLVDEAREMGYICRLLLVPGAPHNELGGICRRLFSTLAKESLEAESFMLPNTSSKDSKKKAYGVGVVLPEGATALAQLQIDGKNVGKIVPLKGGWARWQVPTQGVARARVYVDLPGKSERRAFGSFPIRF